MNTQGQRPYKFERMTGAEFSAALNRLDLTLGQFCRLTGSAPKRAAQWLDGSEDCPPWLPVFIAALGCSGGIEAARDEAERRLIQ